MTNTTRHLFGPVNSRRLGKSLGIDLLPFKTCSLDCLYCECGWTTHKTRERQAFIPTSEVLAELDRFLADAPDLDYITFSGSGEPTLHTGIGEIVRHIKQHYPRYKVAVLSNGTLLGNSAVQADLQAADLVIPSLDAATNKAFRKICRPAPGMRVESVIEGIARFRRNFSGLLLLEIFIVPGMNDSEEELLALKHAATHIGPDAIQLNSLDRPAPYPGVAAVSTARREEIRRFMHPLQVQPVRQRAADEALPWENQNLFKEIQALVAAGPVELARLSLACGVREGDLAKTLARMAHLQLLEVGPGQAASAFNAARRSATESPADS